MYRRLFTALPTRSALPGRFAGKSGNFTRDGSSTVTPGITQAAEKRTSGQALSGVKIDSKGNISGGSSTSSRPASFEGTFKGVSKMDKMPNAVDMKKAAENPLNQKAEHAPFSNSSSEFTGVKNPTRK